MKKYILILIILANSEILFAERVTTDNGTSVAAREQTMQMQAQVKFNEFEYIKILKLNEKRLLDLKEANNLYHEDKVLLAASVKMINHDFDQEVLKILSPWQRKDFVKYRNSTEYIANLKKE